MKFTMTKPCANCPFRSDIPGYITGSRAREIAHALLAQDKTFSCHKTVDYSETGDGDNPDDHLASKEEQHCAGALIFCESQGHANQMMRIAERLGMYDHTKLDMTAPVFKNTSTFVRHHHKSTKR